MRTRAEHDGGAHSERLISTLSDGGDVQRGAVDHYKRSKHSRTHCARHTYKRREKPIKDAFERRPAARRPHAYALGKRRRRRLTAGRRRAPVPSQFVENENRSSSPSSPQTRTPLSTNDRRRRKRRSGRMERRARVRQSVGPARRLGPSAVISDGFGVATLERDRCPARSAAAARWMPARVETGSRRQTIASGVIWGPVERPARAQSLNNVVQRAIGAGA